MRKWKFLLGPMRLPFLVLAPACVSVGAGTAYWQTGQIETWHLVLVLIGALSAHISVNVFNEYYDFRSGLDMKTQPTPFSGGSGTLPAQPEMARKVLYLAWVAFFITASIGLYFLWMRGWQILLVGSLGLILLITYTIWWVYQPVLCLMAPGIGFGVLMVMGTHFALSGTYSWQAGVASLVPTFLVSDLLLLNQFPDVEADRSVGREHFPILIGRRASAVLYGVILLLAYLTVILGVALGLFPRLSLIALLTGALAWKAFQGVRQHAKEIPNLIPVMGINVLLTVLTPLLLSLSLFLA